MQQGEAEQVDLFDEKEEEDLQEQDRHHHHHERERRSRSRERRHKRRSQHRHDRHHRSHQEEDFDLKRGTLPDPIYEQTQAEFGQPFYYYEDAAVALIEDEIEHFDFDDAYKRRTACCHVNDVRSRINWTNIVSAFTHITST